MDSVSIVIVTVFVRVSPIICDGQKSTKIVVGVVIGNKTLYLKT